MIKCLSLRKFYKAYLYSGVGQSRISEFFVMKSSLILKILLEIRALFICIFEFTLDGLYLI